MNLSVRHMRDEDMEEIVQMSLVAWEPVFQSFSEILGSTIFLHIYPNWREDQRRAVETICRDMDKYITCIAELDGAIAGFAAYDLNSMDLSGEIQLLAVHPDFQNRGVGTYLTNVVLDEMAAAGTKLAVVGTGGDPAHAPARRSYEKAGFVPLPNVRYYKSL